MPAHADIDRLAIQHVVQEHHRAPTHVASVLLEGQYALARGTADGSALQDGLRLERSGWRITCELGATPATSSILVTKCGFPQETAAQVADEAAADKAIAQGDFLTAATAEKRAAAAATGPSVNDERARAQLLRELNTQMRIGAISRQEAIRRWSQFRLTWALP